MTEHVETLKCPQGHEVEVHWEGRRAANWQCPDCVTDPAVADEDTLVPFKGGK